MSDAPSAPVYRRKAEGVAALAEIFNVSLEEVESLLAAARGYPGDDEILGSPLPDVAEVNFSTRRIVYHYQDYLYALIRLRDTAVPQLIVETGVEAGRSTYRILQAFDDMDPYTRRTLASIDHTVSRDLIERVMPKRFLNADGSQRRNWVHLQMKSEDALRYLSSQGFQPDIFLHDSDHAYDVQAMEYDWAWNTLKPGGFLCSDDLYWGDRSAWNDFCDRTKAKFWGMGNMGVIRK